jgi:hypothetical protein
MSILFFWWGFMIADGQVGVAACREMQGGTLWEEGCEKENPVIDRFRLRKFCRQSRIT